MRVAWPSRTARACREAQGRSRKPFGGADDVEAEGVNDPHREQHVVEIVGADEARRDLHVARRGCRQSRRSRMHPTRRAAREDVRPLAARLGAHTHAVAMFPESELTSEGVVHVQHDAGRSKLREEPPLHTRVGLHRSVKIEVVLRKVGERGHPESHGLHAPELDRV
jgi:hypothetical protein